MIGKYNQYQVKPFDEMPNGAMVSTILEIVDVTERLDKNGNKMAFITGVNTNSTVRMLVFATVWAKVNIEEGKLYFVKGKKDKESLLVNSVEEIEC